MHIHRVLLASWLATGLVTGSFLPFQHGLQRRQDSSNSAFPTLGSSSGSASVNTASATRSNSNTQSSPSATNTNVATSNASGSGSTSTSAPQNTASSSSTIPTSSASASSTSTASLSTNNGTTNGSTTVSDGLPLEPRITPALSVGGVVLMLTGIVYALIGVKNRWVHIFLSTAYLSSLSICVLIIYVMNPPVSNAIQGAYFVGIFMTGIIFGAGALIFKEVTEGLGCLLGGFSLAMWFLTLKNGGLISSASGKGIFIAVFCALAWSFSFSHYTRPYALMGSTAFTGGTAFVLGIDCFSRGGLKEFWLYIWGLNSNLFPLDTGTYPITRGTRVETVVIVLACIIGIISQIKLWKVVRDRQKKREAAKQEDEQRREVVEAALGRHLERQNDRDRTQWEKQYGNRLNAKRDTVLWADTIGGEKRYSRISETEVNDSHRSSSSESLEMGNMPRKPKSVYVGRVKRQSGMPVQTILEGEEGESVDKAAEQEKSLSQLEGTPINDKTTTPPGSPMPSPLLKAVEVKPLQSLHSTRPSIYSGSEGHQRDPSPTSTPGKRVSTYEQYLLSPEEETRKKRLSWSSMFSRSAKGSGSSPQASPSQEALVVPQLNFHHSRASSLAATLDSENEVLEFPGLSTDVANSQKAPEIVISAARAGEPEFNFQREHDSALNVWESPPSDLALSEHFDNDPEELVRPPVVKPPSIHEVKQNSLGPVPTKRHSGSDSKLGTESVCEDGSKQHTLTSDSSASDILTQNALDRVPSHLSNVVLSYRTNEWAKHIATADAPMYEEPQTIEAEDNEQPAHLTNIKELSGAKEVAEPPPIPNLHIPDSKSPIEAAVSSPTDGVRVNPATQLAQQYPIAVRPEPALRLRSASDLNHPIVPRGFRSSSTPLLKQTLQETPIDENSTSQFGSHQQVTQFPSAQSSSLVNGRGSSAFNWPTAAQRSTSRLSNVSERPSIIPRSNSQMSNHTSMIPRTNSQQSFNQAGNMMGFLPNRSETRLASYNSHQPVRRDTSGETQRREARFADWRTSQANSPQYHAEQAEAQRQQLLWQRQHDKALEEEEKLRKANMEIMLDARMRTKDMQELHREALRKMQRTVSLKAT